MHPNYLHGSQAAEQSRLETQARLLGGANFLPALPDGAQVLDVGCGTGAIAREVAGLVGGDGKVVGVDRNEDQLATARKLASAEERANIEFARAEVESLPFDAGRFDVVYCRFVLEHVTDPVAVIREMARVTNPGGIIIAYEWHTDCADYYPDMPSVEEVWHAICRLQARFGSDPWIAVRLLHTFHEAGLEAATVEGRAWSVSAADPDALKEYVAGAREIVSQAATALRRDRLLPQAVLNMADQEYERLLADPAAYVYHAFCLAQSKVDA